jgi:hypothetical protein
MSRPEQPILAWFPLQGGEAFGPAIFYFVGQPWGSQRKR